MHINSHFHVYKRTVVPGDVERIMQMWLLEKFSGLDYLLLHWQEVVPFMVDLLDPIKLSVVAPPANIMDRNNTYNELNLRDGNSRNAFISQIERLIKSWPCIVYKLMHRNIEMDVALDSDFDHLGRPLRATYSSKTPSSYKFNRESWIFVNGISGEYYWLKLYCDRLCERFGRKILGVFNRGDGILWDLIECINQRNFAKDTASSSQSADKLEEILRAELQNPEIDKIAMIAYSQGCLVLKLALTRIIEDPDMDNTLFAKLRVFTFGNPAVDWKYKNENLAMYSGYTEHYANNEDFVAKLGVIAPRQQNYKGSRVFVNPYRKGHLFGIQYSLEKDMYGDGDSSNLLATMPHLDLA